MTSQEPSYAESDDDIQRRFRAAGVIVPADRAAGTYAAARRLLSSLYWLRQPRPAAAEPSNIFLPGGDQAR